MSYVLVRQNYIALGPRTWNKAMFEAILRDEYNITANLPVRKEDSAKIQLDAETKICLVSFITPQINEKIQVLSAPIFNTAGDIVIAQYDILSKPIDQVKSELKAKVASARWEKENGGVVVNGNKILTDVVSQGKMIGALSLGDLKPGNVIRWKGANGWVELNHIQLRAVAKAVGDHVQGCFNREKELSDLIDDCTTLAELDALDLTF